MAAKERELEGVVKNLAACLAARLGLDPPSPGLDAGLAAALGKRLGVKGEVTMLGLLARMGDFGLDLAHIEVTEIREVLEKKRGDIVPFRRRSPPVPTGEQCHPFYRFISGGLPLE